MRTVADGLVAQRHDDYASVWDALDFALQNAKLWRIDKVVSKVDGQDFGLDAAEPWLRVVAVRAIERPCKVIRVDHAGPRYVISTVKKSIGCLARWQLLLPQNGIA